ncbi:MAG TPA: hypothetical protein VLM89_14370, partial [Phycisphaerae bacterium]|nr:hypothetical protein [Phycisphaerae bacterium]
MHERADIPEQIAGEPVNKPTGTAQDLQRAALHELVDLAAERAAREVEIGRHFRAAVKANEEECKKAREDIERRREALLAEFKQKHAETLDKIHSQSESDLAKLHANEKTGRRQIEQEYATADQGVKKKLSQAAWLAETVFESEQ